MFNFYDPEFDNDYPMCERLIIITKTRFYNGVYIYDQWYDEDTKRKINHNRIQGTIEREDLDKEVIKLFNKYKKSRVPYKKGE